MQIAICDDDLKTVGWLESLIHEEFGRLPYFTCDSYLSAEELLAAVQSHSAAYSIYLLDIEMKQMNGLEAARQLRSKDDKAVIIFVTSHKELMNEAFEVLAFQYLVKPLQKEELLRVLKKAWHYLSVNRNLFHFQFNKIKYSVACEDICYFESIRRLVCVHTGQKNYEYYDTMKELAKKLDSSVFVQVHAAYIINLNFLESFNGKYVMLQNQVGLPVSKTYLKNFNEQYKQYIWMRM